MNDEQLKMLIAQSVDGGLSDAELATVNEALAQSKALRDYRDELLRLKSVMDQWSGLSGSADWERKLNKQLANAGMMEDTKMKMKNWKSVSVLVVILLAVSFTLQTYIKRGLQGGLKSASDDIGDQYSVGNTNLQQAGNGLRVPSQGNVPAMADFNRKIIQTVTLSLEVANSRSAQMQINSLVSRYNGIIANSSLTTSANGASAKITFKVLPAHLAEVLSEIHNLGKVENENMTGQDVTAQFVDLDSRLKNLKVERDRLIKLMEEKPGKITDVLEVERDLTRVTGDIEAMEGQLRVLTNLSDLATVTVDVHEPVVVKKPGFWSSLYIHDRFYNAVHTCFDFGLSTINGIIMVFGFVLPVGLVSLIIWGIVRFIQNRKNKK